MTKLTEAKIRKVFRGVKFQRIANGTVLLVKETTNAQYKKLKKMEGKLQHIFDVEIVNFV